MIIITILISIGILFIACLIMSTIAVIKYAPDLDNIHNLKDAISDGNEKWQENQDNDKIIRLEKIQKERNKWLKNGKIYKYVEKAVTDNRHEFEISPYLDKAFIIIDAIKSIPGFYAEYTRHNTVRVTWRL
jgi:hypothetical protein